MGKMGDRICLMRNRCGLTMQQLADKLGVQNSTINKYEKGIVENIPRTTILNMSKIFGCEPTWLMGFDETETDPLIADISKQTSAMNEEQLKRLLEYAKYLNFQDGGKRL